MQQILEQLESARRRLDLSPIQLRQLAFETVQGVEWPVQSYADMDLSQLRKLLDVMLDLERSEVAKRMRVGELVSR